MYLKSVSVLFYVFLTKESLATAKTVEYGYRPTSTSFIYQDINTIPSDEYYDGSDNSLNSDVIDYVRILNN